MHKNATKCNKTQSKWCINKHGAPKIIDMFETYQYDANYRCSTGRSQATFISFLTKAKGKRLVAILHKGTITSWVQCTNAFMPKFFPPAKTMQLRLMHPKYNK
jgi:hypothetical protein